MKPSDDGSPRRGPAALMSRLRVRRLVAFPVALGLVLVVPLGAYTAAQALEHAAAETSAISAGGTSGSQLIARADAHLDTTSIELSVSISQTESACQAALNGQYCVRYSLAVDEKPVQMGYGLIPGSAVTFTGSSISISVDATTSRFRHLVGTGGSITVTWSWKSTGTAMTAGGQTSTLAAATVTGTALGQTLAGAGLVGSVLLDVGG